MDLIPRPTTLHQHDGHLGHTDLAPPRGPADIVELAVEVLGDRATGTFSLDDSAADLGDEGYRLAITGSGVRASARTTAGLRWAVATLRQLADQDYPHVDIIDIPRYGWRGALLDVARWCHPISFVRTFVDAMALHKLNTLHLHLTDDQGWRFEVLKYPRLTDVGSIRSETGVGLSRTDFDGVPHGGFYTQAELRDLVAYAARRGVRVMPEIDLPGHMQAAISAYPELGNDPSRQLPVRTTWGISSHILNCEPATVAFVRDVLDEVVDVFPFELVHLGGDEVPPTEWETSESARVLAAAAGLPDVSHLVGWWTREMGKHLAQYGRRVAGWDEILEAGAPASATVFAWRDNSYVARARAAGHPVVAAPQEYVYLDWAESDDASEPLAIPNGITTLERVASFQPGDVLGLQGQMWSEYVPRPELVGHRLYPRLAAIAEIGWVGATDANDLRSRFATHRRRLDAIGMAYRWR
jgi:hexosaminidase